MKIYRQEKGIPEPAPEEEDKEKNRFSKQQEKQPDSDQAGTESLLDAGPEPSSKEPEPLTQSPSAQERAPEPEKPQSGTEGRFSGAVSDFPE